MSEVPAVRTRLASLAMPAVATGIALAVLVSLGNWQLDRKSWKEGLLAQIESRAYGEAGEVLPEASWSDWRAEADEFRRIELRGTLLHDLTVPIHGLAEERRGLAVQGFYLFTPLRRSDGSVVVVNRGFVPTELRDATLSAAASGPSEARIVGLVRAPETRALFVPGNDAGRNSWFVRNLSDIAEAKRLTRVAPFYVDADATPQTGGWPKGGQTQLTLRNSHLQYAVTWFGLAGTLIAVFGAFAWRRWTGREPGSAGELEARDTGHDQSDAAEPHQGRRFAE
ncbi:SURF1 family protein [uncultured Enterovirga sp.]|uniref:SURF1 family protein n=1 Tax=uncultured Enterovirga sp. TaxID=2026352 RepID=UPI0035CA173A